ncbi:glycine receptor subunit alphaZ1-like [Saccoglossus kowalevskii]
MQSHAAFYRYADILYDIINDENYDNQMRPSAGGPPVNVSVSLFITSIHSLSEISMDFGATLFLSLYWLDPRFIFNGTEPIALRSGSELLDKLWTPDLYFVNVKEGQVHKVTIINRHIRVSPNGTILYDMRVSVILICNLYLHHYPMDKQTCRIEIESFGYTTSDVRLLWDKNFPADIQEDLVMPEFSMSYPAVNSTVVHYPQLGDYDQLYCSFSLHRELIYYVLEHYVPSTLMVIVSWVSFWLNVEATPARAGLGITTALTLATLSSSARAHMAKVSYTKAIDIWMLVCSLFVFAALVEFALASYFHKKIHSERYAKQRDDVSNGNSWIELQERASLRRRTGEKLANLEGKPTSVHIKTTQPSDFKRISKTIDKYSRFFFPFIFTLFNVIYWPYYLHGYYN